jgi:hypothetical protein
VFSSDRNVFVLDMQLYSAPTIPQHPYIASGAPQISTVANGDMSAFIPDQTMNFHRFIPNSAPQITTVVSGVSGASDMLLQQFPQSALAPNFEDPHGQGPHIVTVDGNGMVVMPRQPQVQLQEHVGDAPQTVTQAKGSIDVEAPKQTIHNAGNDPQIVTNAEGNIIMPSLQQQIIEGAPQIQTVARGDLMASVNNTIPPHFINNANAPQIQTVQKGGMVFVQQPAQPGDAQNAPQIV